MAATTVGDVTRRLRDRPSTSRTVILLPAAIAGVGLVTIAVGAWWLLNHPRRRGRRAAGGSRWRRWRRAVASVLGLGAAEGKVGQGGGGGGGGYEDGASDESDSQASHAWGYEDVMEEIDELDEHGVNPILGTALLEDDLESGDEEEGLVQRAMKRSSPSKVAIAAVRAVQERRLLILHFNDVYDVAPGTVEPVGGAAKFCTAIKAFEPEHPFIVFSGDLLSPSRISVSTKGHHMIPVMNHLKVDVSVYGNHDFDFGIPNLEQAAAASAFPWLISNAFDKKSGAPLANGVTKLIMERNGIKLGLMGIIEEDWLVCLGCVDPATILFKDFQATARELAAQLREEGAEVIIALTHMRQPNDDLLAATVPEIDIILGGHDHHYLVQTINGVCVVKSGTDFKQFSEIRMVLPAGLDAKPTFDVVCHNVTSDIADDPFVVEQMKSYQALFAADLNRVIGYTSEPLDARFVSVRNRETNLGNLICDIVKMCFHEACDAVLINSGTFRSDTIHGPGPLTLLDLDKLMPQQTLMVVVELRGDHLLAAMENSVAAWPKLEGRFPQVSGIQLVFDETQPPGQRVVRLAVAGQLVQPDQYYRIATPRFMAIGKDGYDALTKGKVLIDEDRAPILPVMMRSHFRTLGAVSGLSTHENATVVRAAHKLLRRLHSHIPANEYYVHPIRTWRIIRKKNWETAPPEANEWSLLNTAVPSLANDPDLFESTNQTTQ